MPTAPLGSYNDYQWQGNMPFQQSTQGQAQAHPRATPAAPNSQIPIDPSLQLPSNWPSYYPYQQQQGSSAHPMPPRQHSESSSQGADSPTSQFESHAPSNPNGKRSVLPGTSQPASRKKPRKEEGKEEPIADAHGSIADKDEKSKPTRGSRACTVCRRLKMKCVGAENGPPCKRCIAGNHECIFEESHRGKRTPNTQVKKHELLTKSLRKMERTLDTVLRSISNPGMVQVTSGAASRSPSPTAQTLATQALISSPSPPPTTSFRPPRSPKLHSLPDNALNPLGLLAEASLANRKVVKTSARSTPTDGSGKAESSAHQKVGVANDGYFKPGPMTILPLRRLYIERQLQPEILSFVSTEEVVELFKIFYRHVNPHCSLLVEEFHTPSLICSRSPFLLTTICAISAKFYTPKPDLHVRLNNLAKQLSFSVPEKGYKSVEIVQAYLLLTMWGAGHTENYEQEKTWLLLGMAIRVATDLNLHRKTAVPSNDSPEGQAREREVRNRERTWLLCFILDRSISAQMGKPHSIKEDNIVRNAGQWWQHASAVPPDAGICAYVELQRIMSRSLDFLYSGTNSVSGLQTDCDYLVVTKTIETQLVAWHNDWQQYRSNLPSTQDESIPYRKLIAKFYFNYALLVVNSFGLQNAMERSAVDIGHFFARCHTAAATCAYIVRDELVPHGFLRFSPDSHFVQISYAVLTLLKLVRSEFHIYMENETKTIDLVRDIANVLGEVAVGPQHTPALYGAFLKALITAKNQSRAASPSLMSGGLNGFSGTSAGGTPKEPVFTMNSQPEPTRDLAFANAGVENDFLRHDFQMSGEMGPVADISTFPPTMMNPGTPGDMNADMLSVDSILSTNFWDNVIIPGYSNSFEGLSGGMIYGAGGSGLITPRVGSPSPLQALSINPAESLRSEKGEVAGLSMK